MTTLWSLRIFALASLVLVSGCGKDRCTPGTTLECICPGSKGAQICKLDGSGYGECVCANPAKAAASKAYRQVIEAFNVYDADRYFGGFADPFCFYAAEKNSAAFRKARGKLFRDKKMRLTTALKVLRANPQEVLLWDTGTWGTTGNAPKPHNKLILMRHVAGVWLVAVEASIKRHKCAPALLAGVPQALLAEVGAATKGGVQVRARLAQMNAKKVLCMKKADRLGRGSSKGNEVICIVETSGRTEGKGELQQMVTGHVTVQKGDDVRQVMRFDSRSEEGSAGRSHLRYDDGKRGHSLKIEFCRPCDPPGYERLKIRAGSFKFDAGTVEVTKGSKDGGF